MTILATTAPADNTNSATSANPRDSWPDWTDEDYWGLGPDSDPDDFRPTSDPDYVPTPEEEAEAVELLNNADDFGPADADWDTLAEAAYAMDRVCWGTPWL